MAYSPSTTILGTSRGDPEAIYQWAKAKGCKRPADVKLYLETMSKLCRSAGLRFEVAVAQSIHETADPDTGAPWVSYWWAQRANPAGIGITGDTAQNSASRTFADGAASARSQFAHLWLYAAGTSLPTGVTKSDDPRWDAAVQAGYAGIADTIADLTNRWGMDNQYAQGVVKWLNVLDQAGLLSATTPDPLPEIPSGDSTVAEITYGRVPKPAAKQIDTSRKPEGTGWNNLGKRKPLFVVLHRMVGSLAGTDSWFAQPDVQSLTDFGLGIAAMDGSGKSGELHQYNDPTGNRSGWASGPVSSPYGDAAILLAKYDDKNICNINGVSLEISGNYETPITDSEKQRIAEFMAYWWDYMKIPYTSAPINPETGASAVTWHQEWTIGTGKTCPGPVVMNATNDLIARATAILKQYQTSGSGDGTGGDPDPLPELPTYATPQIPAWLLTWKGEPVLHDVPGVKDGTVFATTAQYRAIKATPRLQYATSGSAKVGPDINAGEMFPVAFIFTAADGKQYGVTKYGTRTLLADLEVVNDTAVAA